MKLNEDVITQLAEQSCISVCVDTVDGSEYFDANLEQLTRFAHAVVELDHSDECWTGYGKKEDWN
jgi:hypothetical protein